MNRFAVVLVLGFLWHVLPSRGLKLPEPTLWVFGGSDHKTFLGCLTCDRDAAESIFNSSGKYGHCGGVLFDNLYCHSVLSDFGSTGMIAQETSACGSSSKDPPVIVDPQGRYYGRFAVSTLLGHDDSVCSSLSAFHNDSMCKVVTRVCQAASWN